MSDKLDIFGQWYELYTMLKTMDKSDPKYQELSEQCDKLKQEFNNMFK